MAYELDVWALIGPEEIARNVGGEIVLNRLIGVPAGS